MKKFMTILGLAMLANTGMIYAQYSGDALRFSQTNYGSSSRFKGLGNAQISLGGDISSIGGNPAGLGMFTRSEFSITPEFNNTKAEANYLGQNTSGNRDRLNLAQAGIVWYNPTIKAPGSDLNKGVISFVWGIGYNRNNDFSAHYNYAGRNANNSVGDFLADDANFYNAAPTQLDVKSLANMAYEGFLIDNYDATNNLYRSAVTSPNDQAYSEVRFGSTSEVNFAGAMNISNTVYLGASIGLVNMRYGYDSEFMEIGTNNSVDPENEFSGQAYTASYRKSQTTNGSGINGRIGLIVKPVNSVRIGATFQTPTWMHIEDISSEVLDTRYGSTSFNNDPSNYVFQYNIRTPYKGSLGASILLGNSGLITADVDYVDYSSIKFSTAENYYDPTTISNNNLDVSDFYQSAVNYRVGAEFKVDQLLLRAGYGVNGTPYKDDDRNVFKTTSYSGGLGYRVNQYYIDLAYQRVETNQTFSPYILEDFSEPVADVKLNKNNVFLTLGVRF